MILLLPMMIILGKYFSINGVLASGPISDVLSAIIITIALIIEYKKGVKKDEKYNSNGGI